MPKCLKCLFLISNDKKIFCPTRLTFCRVKSCLCPDKWPAYRQKLFAGLVKCSKTHLFNLGYTTPLWVPFNKKITLVLFFRKLKTTSCISIERLWTEEIGKISTVLAVPLLRRKKPRNAKQPIVIPPNQSGIKRKSVMFKYWIVLISKRQSLKECWGFPVFLLVIVFIDP